MRSVLTRRQRVANQLPATRWRDDHSASDHRPAPTIPWDAPSLKRLFQSTLREEQVIVHGHTAWAESGVRGGLHAIFQRAGDGFRIPCEGGGRALDLA